jgi:hypothetical protein
MRGGINSTSVTLLETLQQTLLGPFQPDLFTETLRTMTNLLEQFA